MHCLQLFGSINHARTGGNHVIHDDDILAFVHVMQHVRCAAAMVELLRYVLAVLVRDGQHLAFAVAMAEDPGILAAELAPQIACRNGSFSGYV